MAWCDCPSGRAMAAGDGTAYRWWHAAHTAYWPGMRANPHPCGADRDEVVAAYNAVEGRNLAMWADIVETGERERRRRAPVGLWRRLRDAVTDWLRDG